MSVITFEQIHARVAEHQRAEAVRNGPIAVARRAIYQLVSAYVELSAEERLAILKLLREEAADLASVTKTKREARADAILDTLDQTAVDNLARVLVDLLWAAWHREQLAQEEAAGEDATDPS